jgi:hypothetical protein
MFLKVIYFHVYNAHYKDGNYHNDIPSLTAYGITATSLSFILLSLIAFINQLFMHTRLTYNSCMGILITSLIAFYFVFLHQKRYNEIYHSIKDSQWDTKPVRMFSWLVIFLAFAGVVLYSYFFNRTVNV